MYRQLTEKKQGYKTAKNRQLPVIKAIIIFILLAVITSVSICWAVTHPPRHQIARTPASKGLIYHDVTFPSRVDNLEIKGWLIPSPKSDRTVIIAHGYRNNRLQDDVPALSLAGGLVQAGYNVLMFDFRNCGESPGDITSWGLYEVRDLLGAIDFIRKQKDISHRIALFGFSMGASTSILAGAREPAVDAVIADSPFADLKKHLSNKTYPLGFVLLPEFSLITGLDPGKVSPINALPLLSPKPLMLIHGDADRIVPVSNSRELSRAYGDNAILWIVPGAGHLKAYEKAGPAYLAKVINFLNASLK
ncbi:Alpha/beta hydrolase family protein [Desulfotomaculum arcticum]|uniref:Alpha/beta hydrolase family protein n=1 Tax=Desulfotruncus arcticus DSM 17038 TaxID=1121424 RepID=A0A1I2P7L8_9FIRM|nr:alpha/beta fold hydrolase [Desulfotruncus arcticus]SFG12118.1 Alpha/beta hydrolase family protein [Desulfotomaculum arcticum] [Desulfotruncus arcticus DSM 17038]